MVAPLHTLALTDPATSWLCWEPTERERLVDVFDGVSIGAGGELDYVLRVARAFAAAGRRVSLELLVVGVDAALVQSARLERAFAGAGIEIASWRVGGAVYRTAAFLERARLAGELRVVGGVDAEDAAAGIDWPIVGATPGAVRRELLVLERQWPGHRRAACVGVDVKGRVGGAQGAWRDACGAGLGDLSEIVWEVGAPSRGAKVQPWQLVFGGRPPLVDAVAALRELGRRAAA